MPPATPLSSSGQDAASSMRKQWFESIEGHLEVDMDKFKVGDEVIITWHQSIFYNFVGVVMTIHPGACRVKLKIPGIFDYCYRYFPYIELEKHNEFRNEED